MPFCDGAPNVGEVQAWGELVRFIVQGHQKVKGFSDVGQGEKSEFKIEKKFPHKKARHEGEWNQGQDTLKGEKPKQF